jgi:hypothetical protein
MLEDKNPNWLLPMFATIRTRPGMYLGAENIDAIILFTFGYELARSDLGLCGKSASDKGWLRGFGEWLALRAADPDRESREWSHQIHWLDDSTKNIHAFFKLFEEFLQTKGHSLDAVERWIPQAQRRFMSADACVEKDMERHVPEDKTPNWLLPMLATIRTRPGSYLGAETTRALNLFRYGYEEAREELGLCGESQTDKECMAQFGEWLARRAGETDMEMSRWTYQIYQLDSSEKDIHTFFKLFEEFLQTKGQSLDAVERWVPTFSSD